MTDEVFRKTEGRLYRYFRQIKEIEKLKYKIAFFEEQIKQIKQDIKTTNVHLEPELNMGIDYSRDKIQTSSQGSFVENETDRQIDRYEKMLSWREEKLKELEAMLKDKEAEAEDMRLNIGMLNKQFQMFVELKYRDGLKNIDIKRQMFDELTQDSKISHMRHDIVEDIARWCNLIT